MMNSRMGDGSITITGHGRGARVSYCSSLPMMMSGVISDTMGMLPAMKITEPYSPTARAKAMAKPVISAGVMDGRMTLPEGLPARGAQAGGGFFEFLLGILQHGLHGALPRTAGR